MTKRKIRSSDGEELEIVEDSPKPKGKPKPRQLRPLLIGILVIFLVGIAGLVVFLTPTSRTLDNCPTDGCVTVDAVEVILTATQITPSPAPIIITVNPGLGLCSEVMNAETGRIVMSVQLRDTDTSQMFLMDAEARNLCLLDIEAGYGVRWSPDGKRFAYSPESPESDIMIFDTVMQEAEQLTAEGGAYSPDWSPDGRRIAFQDRGSNLYIIDEDSSDWRPLTNDESRNESPAWSPDGRMIAFASTRDRVDGQRERDSYEIYVMEVDSGIVRRLTNNDTWDHLPAWSPDGRQLVFASTVNPDSDAQMDLFIMDVNCDQLPGRCAANMRNITGNGFNNLHPVWLSDGQQIAYISSERGGDRGIYVINIETGDIDRITRPVVQIMEFDWWERPEN